MKTVRNFIQYFMLSVWCIVLTVVKTDTAAVYTSANIRSNDVASALCRRNLVQVGVNKNLYTSYTVSKAILKLHTPKN